MKMVGDSQKKKRNRHFTSVLQHLASYSVMQSIANRKILFCREASEGENNVQKNKPSDFANPSFIRKKIPKSFPQKSDVRFLLVYRKKTPKAVATIKS